MVHAIRMRAPGGPEVLSWDEVDPGMPGKGQVLLRQSAVGLNFIDIYHRTGLYPIPTMPATIGLEAAGVVEAVGPGAGGLKPGDRVAYGTGPLGAYAQKRVMPADRLVKLPDAISERTAASMMLRGMTVEYLLRRTYRVRKGDTILVHAASGGVGLLLCQWAKHLGATVIGTVGSPAKAEHARAHGCDHPILYRDEDFTARVKTLTKGAGVPVVYDSVGRDTFMGSLDCLRPRGLMVLFGQSSGAVAPIDLNLLAQKGSLFVTRPSLMAYNAKRQDLVKSAAALFDIVSKGVVNVEIGQEYPLKEAARAHRDLEARRTIGSTVFVT